MSIIDINKKSKSMKGICCHCDTIFRFRLFRLRYDCGEWGYKCPYCCVVNNRASASRKYTIHISGR